MNHHQSKSIDTQMFTLWINVLSNCTPRAMVSGSLRGHSNSETCLADICTDEDIGWLRKELWGRDLCGGRGVIVGLMHFFWEEMSCKRTRWGNKILTSSDWDTLRTAFQKTLYPSRGALCRLPTWAHYLVSGRASSPRALLSYREHLFDRCNPLYGA